MCKPETGLAVIGLTTILFSWILGISVTVRDRTDVVSPVSATGVRLVSNQNCVCGRSEDAIADFNLTVKYDDAAGYTRLMARDQIYSVQPGDKILVSKTSWGILAQGEMASGSHVGEECWILLKALR